MHLFLIFQDLDVDNDPAMQVSFFTPDGRRITPRQKVEQFPEILRPLGQTEINLAELLLFDEKKN